MNVGIPPTINFADSKTCLGPYILFGKRDPSQEMQRTIRICKLPNNSHPKEPLHTPSYRQQRRSSSPYEQFRRSSKNELNKPIRIIKSTVTMIEIERPKGFYDSALIEQGLSIVNEKEEKEEIIEETATASDGEKEDNEDKPISIKKENEEKAYI